ncbi:hypothetical protein D3C72_1834470 [compost metagenome]
MTETGDRAIDQVRVDRLQRFIVQPVSRQTADLEVFDQDVGLRRQLTHQALTFSLGKVDGHRLLVAIGRQVIGGLAGVFAVGILQEGRAPGASVIAITGTLDLDHLGTKVRKDLTGPRPGQYPRQIQYPQMR